jgi:hypothetical protein
MDDESLQKLFKEQGFTPEQQREYEKTIFEEYHRASVHRNLLNQILFTLQS